MLREFGTAVAIIVSAGSALAECDFQKPVGRCTATITIDSATGSKPSYSAEVTIKSSARSCSKVEYYLDNTPHATLMKQTNSQAESLFGTNPITKRNIRLDSCTAYASADQTGKKADRAEANSENFFKGHWKGTAGLLVFRGPVEVTITSVSGGRAKGSTYFPGDGSTEVIDGRVQGDTLRYSYTDLDHMEITLRKRDANTLEYVGVGGGTTITGRLVRQ